MPPSNRDHNTSADTIVSTRDTSSHSPSSVSALHDSSGSDSDIPRPSAGRPLNRSISVTVGTGSGQDWGTVATAAAAAATQEGSDMPQPTTAAPPLMLSPADGDAPGVVLRKRNNSSGEYQALSSSGGGGVSSTGVGSSNGSSLLAHPSTWLERLTAGTDRGALPPPVNTNLTDSGNLSSASATKSHCVIGRPVMSFIFQHYDLETLAYAMRHSTRKAAARVYGMQALNWLLRSVTQPTCLHDLLWCFVSAMTPHQAPSPPAESVVAAEDSRQPDHQNNTPTNIIDMVRI